MSSSSSSSSSNIVVRLPLVFSTTNDDVVASCSVREQKREERHIQNALVSLSTHKKEKKATKKVDVAVSPVVIKSVLCPKVFI